MHKKHGFIAFVPCERFDPAATSVHGILYELIGEPPLSQRFDILAAGRFGPDETLSLSVVQPSAERVQIAGDPLAGRLPLPHSDAVDYRVWHGEHAFPIVGSYLFVLELNEEPLTAFPVAVRTSTKSAVPYPDSSVLQSLGLFNLLVFFSACKKVLHDVGPPKRDSVIGMSAGGATDGLPALVEGLTVFIAAYLGRPVTVGVRLRGPFPDKREETPVVRTRREPVGPGWWFEDTAFATFQFPEEGAFEIELFDRDTGLVMGCCPFRVRVGS